jgi:hypothetical protein
MGNFSRNTFDPTKNYVGVRLQQGVPLIDADWNELNDVIRNEIYSGLGQAFPDGVEPGSGSLQIDTTSPPANNLKMFGGAMLVGGRPLRVPAPVLYSAQPWNNPTRAAQDGVTVIPPLTPPSAGRDDIVYLDVWEREVRSTEDTNLIHPAINTETCVRLKREFAFRVAEGTQTLPATPAGHSFVPLALLKRLQGQVNITHQQIVEDIRPKLFSTRGIRSISFVPAFLPYGTAANPWFFDGATNTGKSTTVFGSGLLPLLLPDGATLLSMRIQGSTAECYFVLFRKQLTNVAADQLFNSAFIVNGGVITDFDSVVSIPSAGRVNIVDNSRYHYSLSMQNGQKSTTINRIILNYQY